MDQPDLSTIVGSAATRRGLRLRDDLREPGWTFWEVRTLNMHRVVGLLDEQRTFADIRDLEAEARGAIARNFHRSWWRGLACGVVARVAAIPWTAGDLEGLVDIHEERRAIEQWVVLAAADGHRAIGAHTWEDVFLSPVYRDTVQGLRANGCQVTTAVKGKDGLMTFLTGVSELQGVSFPEFRDQP